jgi:sugar lactone lactonase YvrE
MLEELTAALLLVLIGCSPGGGGGDQPDAAIIRPPLTVGVSTLAGGAEAGDVDGPREVNSFHNPVGVAIGPDHAVFVADFDNSKIRAVDATGMASTVYVARGFARPFALAVAGHSLYVATDDDPNNAHGPMSGTLWRIDPSTQSAEVIAARIGRPRGLAVLQDGRLAIADYQHHVVELVEPATGKVSVLAGAWDQRGLVDDEGAAARFSTPYALVQRADGALVVVDQDNGRLRVVELDGRVSTLVASLERPEGLTISGAGDLYVSEPDRGLIVRVRDARVDVVAGDGTPGYAEAEDPLQAELYGLEGLAVTSDGTMLYAADGTRGEEVPFNRLRRITLGP